VSAPSFAWLADTLSGIGLQPAALIEAAGGPSFDYGGDLPASRIVEPAVGWAEQVARELPEGAVILNALPASGFQSALGHTRLSDAAGFLHQTLTLLPAGREVAALLPAALLDGAAAGPLRAWLATRHQPTWIILPGPEASTLAGLAGFRMTLLVVRTGPPEPGKLLLLRLANLASTPRSEWRAVLRDAARRGGGEIGPTIVARGVALASEPWTMDRFSREAAALKRDLEAAGGLCALGDLCVLIQEGIAAKTLERRSWTDEAGWLPCYEAGHQAGGRLGAPAFLVPAAEVPGEQRLREGDILVARAPGELCLFRVGAAEAGGTVGPDLIIVRWRPGLPQFRIDMLDAYLHSERASRWLTAHGWQTGPGAAVLATLEVPAPAGDVLDALEQLRATQDQYQAWADDVQRQRNDLFAGSDLRETLGRLIERKELEAERMELARRAGSLEHAVRERFPHPIALRYARLLLLDDGPEKLQQIPETAEHLVGLLAWMGLVQQSTDPTLPAVSAGLRRFAAEGVLNLDWGKKVALFREAVDFTRLHKKPLSLPIPGLARLADAESWGRWETAERELRSYRDRHSHLQRPPAHQLPALCRDLRGWLDAVFEGALFLVRSPLLWVEDYSRDAVSDQRRATFQRLQGASDAFGREPRSVQVELAREDVGICDAGGTFWSLQPWMRYLPCEQCRHRELFALSRYGDEVSTYVAVATGHSLDIPDWTGAIRNLLRPASAAR
jgi:hypothetical protein